MFSVQIPKQEGSDRDTCGCEYTSMPHFGELLLFQSMDHEYSQYDLLFFDTDQFYYYTQFFFSS